MRNPGCESGAKRWLLAAPLWLVIGLCCLLPLAWMAAQVVLHPAMVAEVRISSFRAGLLGRTLLYNGAAALLACIMAIPPAMVVGRGRGWPARILIFLLPLALLYPSIAYTYGWSHVLLLLGIQPFPGKPLDVMRCVWTLATWLWALPALGMGLSLRTMDTQIQQQALLDGGYKRIVARAMLGPAWACFAAAMVLAVQEFAVYEPSGISVVATEVRTVFETGGVCLTAQAISSVTPGGSAGPDQPQRAAAAVATALPLLAIVGVLFAVAAWGLRRQAFTEGISDGTWPRILDAGRWATIVSFALVALNVGAPTVAMIVSLSSGARFSTFLDANSPHIAGSITYGVLAGACALGIGAWACITRSRLLLAGSLATFLIGGQLLAIAEIRLYNRHLRWLGAPLRDLPQWIYAGPAIVVMAYVARFGWLALLAAEASWSRSLAEVREMAAIDGAGPVRTAAAVVWPLVWPLLAGAAVLVMVLSLTELPATALLVPLNPPALVNLLMTWVHQLRYNDMLMGGLLLAGATAALGAGVVALLWLARRAMMGPQNPQSAIRNPQSQILLILLASLLLLSCDSKREPQAVWCDTGMGPCQVVYPRAIAYSKKDDCYFIVDRMARIQRLDRTGKFILEWRMPRWENGKPVGISVAPDGTVYIPDTHYGRVAVYSPDGKFLREWGTEGRADGQFLLPTDVAFDAAGNVYVSEYGGNDRIQVFTPDGKYIRQFGKFGEGPGEFSRPQSILIDGDLLYVTDACNHRLQVFKTDGTFVRTAGKAGSGPGEFRYPYGLDIDSKGRLVVCEFGNNRVQLIDKKTFAGLGTWGAGGRDLGQLAYPWAVAVGKGNQFVVVDSGNNRLQVFGF